MLGFVAKPLVAGIVLLLSARAPIDLLSSSSSADDALFSSKVTASKVVNLRRSARQFAACLSSGRDINVPAFVDATDSFMADVSQMGDFAQRGVQDTRQNIARVRKALGGRISSMRAMLLNEVQHGARRPEGGPTTRSAAEALLWARLGLSMWVETFKKRLSSRGSTLRDATREGFQRSLARYFDRFGRAAFAVASRSTPDWDDIRARTHIGCRNGVCSDEHLESELKEFVQELEPVLQRMTIIQKSVGLEDPRTP